MSLSVPWHADLLGCSPASTVFCSILGFSDHTHNTQLRGYYQEELIGREWRSVEVQRWVREWTRDGQDTLFDLDTGELGSEIHRGLNRQGDEKEKGEYMNINNIIVRTRFWSE
jgi:hypothetical protein